MEAEGPNVFTIEHSPWAQVRCLGSEHVTGLDKIDRMLEAKFQLNMPY